jgi:hypothetical protein
MYEVYKHAKRLLSEEAALEAVAAMQKTQLVPLTEELALLAADLSLAYKLPMATPLCWPLLNRTTSMSSRATQTLPVSTASYTSRSDVWHRVRGRAEAAGFSPSGR